MSKEKLFEAIASGDTNAVMAFAHKDPALAVATNESGISAILFALYYRKGELAARLADGLTTLGPAEAAALGRSDSLCEQLAKDPTLLATPTPDGFTLLHLSCFFARLETTKRLLERGADTEATVATSKLRPLHNAVAGGSAEIVALLLTEGASPNVQQAGGWTPLHAAAKHGNQQMVASLLEHGADVTLLSDDGQTAMTLATEAQHAGVVRSLREATHTST